jgi:hypothetical protein
MEEVYNTTVFRKHVNSCSGPTKAVRKNMPPPGTPTLFAMAASNNWSKTQVLPSSPLVELPCPGLTKSNIPLNLKSGFETYLIRTPMPGGGGPTTDEVTDEIFPGWAYISLSDRQKNEVRSVQRQHYRWYNHANLQKIFSATCCKMVQVQPKTQPTPACYAYIELTLDKAFKQALSVPLPLNKNRKYTPKALIDQATIDRYGVISGLKDLIDANEKAGHFVTPHYIFSFRLCRTHTYLASIMLLTSLMASIKMDQMPFLHH